MTYHKLLKYSILAIFLSGYLSYGICSSMPAPKSAHPYFLLELAKDAINTDNIQVGFKNNASAKYDPNTDAPYFEGFGAVSLSSLSSDMVPLAINTLPYPKTSENIGLVVNCKTSGRYKLYLKNIVDIPQLFDIWLVDIYKNDSVELRHTRNYNFDVVINDSLSFGSKRFFLVIRQNVAYTLHLNSFDAILVDDSAKTAKQVQVNWKTENEENYTGFEVERSIDEGKTFVGIDSIQSTAAGTYSFLDKSPIIGQTMYRLKLTDISDSSSYSKVALILYALPEKEPVKNTVKVFPNPAQNTINLFIVHTDAPSRSYNITITNASGILVRRVTSTDANWKGNVDDLMPGIYLVRVINNTTNLLVGNAKFLKM